jgi:hypothetical protein
MTNVSLDTSVLSQTALSLKITIPEAALSKLESHLSEAFVEARVHIILDAYEFWKSQAAQLLTTSRKQYLDSLSIESTVDGPEIVLEGKFPNMVEMGTALYSLKPGFLANPNRPNGTSVIPMIINGSQQFRTVKIGPQNTKWEHPGFGPGINLRKDTAEHIKDVLVPQYFYPLIQQALGKK